MDQENTTNNFSNNARFIRNIIKTLFFIIVLNISLKGGDLSWLIACPFFIIMILLSKQKIISFFLLVLALIMGSWINHSSLKYPVLDNNIITLQDGYMINNLRYHSSYKYQTKSDYEQYDNNRKSEDYKDTRIIFYPKGSSFKVNRVSNSGDGVFNSNRKYIHTDKGTFEQEEDISEKISGGDKKVIDESDKWYGLFVIIIAGLSFYTEFFFTKEKNIKIRKIFRVLILSIFGMIFVVTTIGLIKIFFDEKSIISKHNPSPPDQEYIKNKIFGKDSDNRGYSDRAKSSMEEDLYGIDNEGLKNTYINHLKNQRNLALSINKEEYIKYYILYSKMMDCMLTDIYPYHEKNTFNNLFSQQRYMESEKMYNFMVEKHEDYLKDVYYPETEKIYGLKPTDVECGSFSK